jgi:hypothetical protein
MPAFTFEKISPPPAVQGSSVKATSVKGATAASVSLAEKKSRGVIGQILGRLLEARVERVLRVERRVINQRGKRPPE